jgi:hypothetical protein
LQSFLLHIRYLLSNTTWKEVQRVLTLWTAYAYQSTDHVKRQLWAAVTPPTLVSKHASRPNYKMPFEGQNLPICKYLFWITDDIA